MAVLIPLAISAAAGAAGVGATMATVATVAGSLVAAKSGMSARMDRAATKVFGSDMVKLGNIAGTFLIPSANTWGASRLGAGAAGAAASGAVDYSLGSATANPGFSTALSSGTGEGLRNVASSAGLTAPGVVPAAATAAAAPAVGGVGALFNRVGTAMSNLSPQAQAALIQTTGQVVAGAAGGASQAAAMKEQERLEREREDRNAARFKSGSRLVVNPDGSLRPAGGALTPSSGRAGASGYSYGPGRV